MDLPGARRTRPAWRSGGRLKQRDDFGKRIDGHIQDYRQRNARTPNDIKSCILKSILQFGSNASGVSRCPLSSSPAARLASVWKPQGYFSSAAGTSSQRCVARCQDSADVRPSAHPAARCHRPASIARGSRRGRTDRRSGQQCRFRRPSPIELTSRRARALCSRPIRWARSAMVQAVLPVSRASRRSDHQRHLDGYAQAAAARRPLPSEQSGGERLHRVTGGGGGARSAYASIWCSRGAHRRGASAKMLAASERPRQPRLCADDRGHDGEHPRRHGSDDPLGPT